ncbi:MAG: protein methyltransferase [Thermoprotei archaeon]|nr:MAG: protein methyltransferase [Thermoprotei archaeon]
MDVGDDVLLFIDRRRAKVVRIKEGGVFSSDKGCISHDGIRGKEWGTPVMLSTGVRAYVLKPLPVDYLMHAFKRVTQVIYPKDLGYMALLAGVRPGYKVLEAGIGTGFLTAILATIVGDEGHIYGYEVREDFARVAKENLRRLGILHRVTIKIADVRYGVSEKDIDAAFLDIPNPWEVVDVISKSLKPSSPILVFLPTANQVIKLLSKLKELGSFIDIRVFETLLREYQPDEKAFRPLSTMIAHTGYIVFSRYVKNT